jgi:hypothetical protein
MQKIALWIMWLGSLLFFAWFVLKIAAVVVFPAWIVILAFVLMESVPLLWIAQIIPHSIAIDRLFVGGWSAVFEILICLFLFYATLVMSTNYLFFIVATLVITVLGCGVAYFRTQVMIRLLSSYDN